MAKITGRHSESFSHVIEAKPLKRDFSRFFAPSAPIITAVCLSLSSYSFGVAPKSAFSAETKKPAITGEQKAGKQIPFNSTSKTSKNTRDKMAEAQKLMEPEKAPKTEELQKIAVKLSEFAPVLEKTLNSLKPEYSSEKYQGKRFSISVENRNDKSVRINVSDEATEMTAKVAQINNVEQSVEKEFLIEVNRDAQMVKIYWDNPPKPFGRTQTMTINIQDAEFSVSGKEFVEKIGPDSKHFLKNTKP